MTTQTNWMVRCCLSGILGLLLTVPIATADPNEARHILSSTGIRGGLIVHIGCGDGRLTVALHDNGRYLVHGLDTDADNIAAAREHLITKGVHGEVSVMYWTGDRLPYTDNLVNLLVVEQSGDVPLAEMMRVLAPRGVAYIKQDGKWRKTIKPRPEDIDDWTHYLYDAGGNAVSRDRLVGPTRYLKWVAGPRWSRSHEYTPSMAAMVSAGGRIYSIHDDGVRGVHDPRVGDRWSVQARDAFNGLILWRRPMAKGWNTAAWAGHGNWGTPMSLPRRLIATEDRIYLTLGFRSPVTVLDALTGETTRELDNTANTDEMVLLGKTLLVRRRKAIPNYHEEASAWKVQQRRGEKLPPAAPGDETIVAVDIENGEPLWQVDASRIVTLSLAACNGRVCYHNFDELVCLDLASGNELWRAECPAWPDLIGTASTLVMYEDIVFHAADRGLFAFSAVDGKPLWKGPRIRRTNVRHVADLQIAGGLLWAGITDDMPVGQMAIEASPFAVPAFSGTALLGLDPRTGEVKRRVDIGELLSHGHHIRCYRNKGTDRYLMWPKRGTEYVDIVDGKNHMRTDWLRGECSYGVMPSDGLVFVPPHPCICSTAAKVNGFFAGSAEPAFPPAREATPRLHRGPAHAMKPAAEKADNRLDDWPMYRHDTARSGATHTPVAPRLATRWKKDLGGKLTQCVVADGRVIVASTDRHTVHALDADDGRTLWSYVADGRVDSAPTIADGRVLFGCHDGWVVCLRAADGELAWRFRAAPTEARLTAMGQLESPWPVLGSVLVHEGVAYISAGRSSYLDGGIHLFGLDINTGKVLHKRHLDGPWPDIAKDVGRPFGMVGAKPDLFTFDGEVLSMGPHEFELNLANHQPFRLDPASNSPQSGRHLMASSGFLDTTWHDRTFWTHGRTWPGRHVFRAAHVAPKSGQILVFDESTTYALKAFTEKTFMSPIHVPGKGYGLFADANDNEPGKNFARTAPPKWNTVVPIRARGLLLAGDTLLLAGCRDVVSKTDPTAAYEGRGPAVLWTVSAADGKRIAEYPLDAPPVNDGLSAAQGRIYLSATDGTVSCMGESSLGADPSRVQMEKIRPVDSRRSATGSL